MPACLLMLVGSSRFNSQTCSADGMQSSHKYQWQHVRCTSHADHAHANSMCAFLILQLHSQLPGKTHSMTHWSISLAYLPPGSTPCKACGRHFHSLTATACLHAEFTNGGDFCCTTGIPSVCGCRPYSETTDTHLYHKQHICAPIE